MEYFLLVYEGFKLALAVRVWRLVRIVGGYADLTEIRTKRGGSPGYIHRDIYTMNRIRV
jgi:uncharacterized membrane protein